MEYTKYMEKNVIRVRSGWRSMSIDDEENREIFERSKDLGEIFGSGQDIEETWNM